MKRWWIVATVLVLVSVAPRSARSQPADYNAEAIMGTVAETMNGGRYTYIRLDRGGSSQWVAASQMDVAVGDTVTVRGGTTMRNFKSPTLNRTFDEILFSEDVQVGAGSSKAAMKLPPGHPPIGGSGMGQSMPAGDASAPSVTGEIVETMDAGNYTYIQVRAADKTIWAATEKFPAKVGERVTVPGGMIMKNFESPTLNRKFDEIYFADYVEREDAGDEPAAESAPAVAATAATVAAPTEIIPQPEGALSIAALNERRVSLAGQEVSVRGKVVKYTEKVMGQNWLHLMDGTGEGDAADITVSTSDAAHLGDIVTAKGRVVINEDLGYGYTYTIMLKDAVLSK